MTARIEYRPEADGLRALSILAVVIYHVDTPLLPGGFVGVDCFFAISGFLIFSLLYREQQTSGSIDWVAFYARRATRLLPEACALIAAVMVAGYFVLLPVAPDVGRMYVLSHRDLAESGAAATFWVANIYYSLLGSGYFEVGADRQPLIHLWSLGVEEQFYIVVPLMFWLAGFLARAIGASWTRSAAILLALTTVVSLAVSIGWTYEHAWSAYYALPTRAYEFALGALAALWVGTGRAPLPAHVSTALAVAGVGAILAACLAFSWDLSFPGAWALVPSLGTVLVILGCGFGAPNAVRAILTRPAVTYLGKISYGWYLWHWPALVFWREYRLYDVSVWSEAAVAAATLVPAAIGYHAVARLRQRSHAAARPVRVLALGAAGLGATLALCGGLVLAGRLAATTPEARVLSARLMDRWQPTPECVKPGPGAPAAWPDCAFGDPDGAVTVVLWGDSHAMQWLPALDPLLKDLHLRGLLRAHAGCSPGLSRFGGPPDRYGPCIEYGAHVQAEMTERARHEPVVVLLFARWALYVSERPYSLVEQNRELPGWNPGLRPVETGLDGLVAGLRAAGIPVGIAQPIPEQRHEAPSCLYRLPPERCAVSWNSQADYMGTARDMVARIAARHGAEVLDVVAELCPGGHCPAARDGTMLYMDDDHLSGEGARSLREPLAALLVKLAGPALPATAPSAPSRESAPPRSAGRSPPGGA